MHTLVLKELSDSGVYVVDKSNSPEMEVFGEFITDDLACLADHVTQELKTEEQYHGNACSTVIEDGTVSIQHTYFESLPIFSIPASEFFNFLKQWEELSVSPPKKIAITVTKDKKILISKSISNENKSKSK